jgi:hypothetical protein
MFLKCRASKASFNNFMFAGPAVTRRSNRPLASAIMATVRVAPHSMPRKAGLPFNLAAKLKTFRVKGMQESEKKLLNALLDLEAAVASMPTANPKPNLGPKFQEIDSLASQLPKGTHPQLIHYLQRKSYQKARLFLQGRDSEN